NSFTPTPSATVTPTPTPDIAISKGASPMVVSSGNNVTYTVVLNVTGSPASNVQVQDVLPASLTFAGVGPLPDGGTFAETPPGNLTWTWPSLPLGAVTLTYQATVGSFVQQGADL